MLHVVMWVAVGISSFFVYYDPESSIFSQICNEIAVCATSTLPFYFTAYFLIPRYLYLKRYAVFITLMVLLIIISGLFTMMAGRSVAHFFYPDTEIIPSDSAKLRFNINLFVWNSLLASFGAGGLKIMSDSFRLRKKLLQAENEKIIAELNFLRSQINPHFLFNTMNTIYFQIDKQNTKARSSVEKLSEMLRYQLYECTTDKIEIKQEIDYIKNYVGIQTLRMEKDSNIQLNISPAITPFKIAPLLILPIVENAFKHVSNFKESSLNSINISLWQENKNFIVETSNTYDQLNGVKHLINSGGLGVQNLRRRLELLYPERYELIVSRSENRYHTLLKVKYYD